MTFLAAQRMLAEINERLEATMRQAVSKRTGVFLGLLGAVVLATTGCKGGTPAEGASEKASPPSSPEAGEGADSAPASSVAPCEKDGDRATCDTAITAAFKAKKFEDAFKLASRGCENDVPVACLLVGRLVEKGQGTAKDTSAAFSAFKKGCDLGDLEACIDLANMLEDVKTEEALKMRIGLLFKACEGNKPYACATLGLKYVGMRNPEMKALGIRLLQRACKLGDKDACESAKREIEWTAEDREIAEIMRRSQPARAPAVRRTTGPPQVLKAEGIEWTVAADLVGRLEVAKASCQRRRTTHPCDVTLRFPQGSSSVGLGAMALHFDKDGVRIGQNSLSPYIDGVEPGGLARLKIFTLSADATKVVFTVQ